MDPLRTFLDHHVWATARLIDHCAGLPAEALAETVPGTVGTIQEALTHLVAADQRYLSRLDGQEADPAVREPDGPADLAVLRNAVEAQAARWTALVERADTLDVTLQRRDEAPVPHAEGLLFLQAVHHGNDHRTHVCTILGAHGREAPDLDGWHYWAK